MQTAVNTDVFIRQVINTLATQMEMWNELKRQKEVEAALYMHLMNKTILAEPESVIICSGGIMAVVASWRVSTACCFRTYVLCFRFYLPGYSPGLLM